MTGRANWKGLEDTLIEAYEKHNGSVATILGSDERFQQFTETQISSKIRDLKRAGILDKALAANGFFI